MTPYYIRTFDFHETIQAEGLCLAAFLLAGRTLLAYAARPREAFGGLAAEDREVVEGLLDLWRQEPADASGEFGELAQCLGALQFSLRLSEPELVSADGEASTMLLAQLTGSRPEEVVWTSKALAQD